MWTGVLAPTYAPDVKVDGVAALAPASNLPGLVDNLGNVTGGELFASYVIDSYSRIYPDVTYREYVRPGAQPIVRQMAGRCLAEKSTLLSVLTLMSLDKAIWTGNPYRGAFAGRLQENIPAVHRGPAAHRPGRRRQPRGALGAGRLRQGPLRCRSAGRLPHVRRPRPRAARRTDSPAIPELVRWTKERLAERPPRALAVEAMAARLAYL